MGDNLNTLGYTQDEIEKFKCLRCKKFTIHLCRKLCGYCYKKYKHLYPLVGIRAKRTENGRGLGNQCRPIPKEATSAPPGSPEKVAVMEQRASRNESLWHPDDAKAFFLDLPPCLAEKVFCSSTSKHMHKRTPRKSKDAKDAKGE